MMKKIAFDIGGTKTRAGLFDVGSATLARSVSGATPNHLDLPEAPFDELLERLLGLMSRLSEELAPSTEVAQLAVAFAGPIDPLGNVIASPTLWGTRLPSPLALGELLGRRWPGARITLLNDVTAAGYRYLRSPDDELCIVTVSSGIGNKVFIGGRPMLGANGAGGELGHLRVDDDAGAPLCECGGRGHLGALSSGRGVLDRARADRRHRGLTSGDLVAAFRREESWARELIEQAAAPLGHALAAMHLGIGLERFVLVGGFALALGEGYRKLVARAAQARCWRGETDWQARVELGFQDDDSGLIGAAIAALPETGAR